VTDTSYDDEATLNLSLRGDAPASTWQSKKMHPHPESIAGLLKKFAHANDRKSLTPPWKCFFRRPAIDSPTTHNFLFDITYD
jgi:hypothetical protein